MLYKEFTVPRRALVHANPRSGSAIIWISSITAQSSAQKYESKLSKEIPDQMQFSGGKQKTREFEGSVQTKNQVKKQLEVLHLSNFLGIIIYQYG